LDVFVSVTETIWFGSGSDFSENYRSESGPTFKNSGLEFIVVLMIFDTWYRYKKKRKLPVQVAVYFNCLK
jgi:hypothetical protein